MCMCACACTCTCTCTCVRVRVMCVYMCICAYIYICVCVCAYVYVCLSVTYGVVELLGAELQEAQVAHAGGKYGRSGWMAADHSGLVYRTPRGGDKAHLVPGACVCACICV